MELRRFLIALTWTLGSAVLFFGFGLLFAGGLVRTLVAAGALERSSFEVAAEIVVTGFGLLLLGLSLLYRRLARGENAGSLAAWLAGWGLLLFGGGQLVADLSPGLAPILLLAVLALWAAARLGSRLRGNPE